MSLSIAERICVALLFVLLAAFFPYFRSIHSANELTRLYLALAILEDGTVSIDGPLERLGGTSDKAERDGRYYSDKAPGAAVALLPMAWLYTSVAGPVELEELVRLSRLWVSTIPTAFLLVGLFAFLREHIRSQSLRIALIVGYALGTPATTYGILLYGHQLSAVLVFGCFLTLRRCNPDSSLWRSAAVGLLAASAVCVEYQNVLFMLPLAGYYLWRVRLRPAAIVVPLLAAAPLAIALGWYHDMAFGSPIKTGYSFLSGHFADVHAQGLLGIAKPQIDTLFLSFLSPRKGLFFFAPFLALAVPGLFFLRRARGDGLATFLMVAGFTVFVCAMVYPEGGWTVSQRHLTPMVPWLLLPIGLLVQLAFPLRPIFTGLVLVSIAITGLSSVVWPHFQDSLSNPYFQLAVPLFEDGWVPPSIFNLVGLGTKPALIGIAGLLVAGAAVDLFVAARRRWLLPIYLAIAAAVFTSHFRLTEPLGGDRSARRIRIAVENDYEPDPLAEPVRQAQSRDRN